MMEKNLLALSYGVVNDFTFTKKMVLVLAGLLVIILLLQLIIRRDKSAFSFCSFFFAMFLFSVVGICAIFEFKEKIFFLILGIALILNAVVSLFFSVSNLAVFKDRIKNQQEKCEIMGLSTGILLIISLTGTSLMAI